MVLGLVIGGAVGVGIGAAVYALLTPVLERSDGLIRETQGLVWNLVPLLALVGAGIGLWIAWRMTSHEAREV